MNGELEGLWSCTMSQIGSSVIATLVPSGDFARIDLDEKHAMFMKTLQKLNRSEYFSEEAKIISNGASIEILVAANSNLQRTNAYSRMLPEISKALKPNIAVNEHQKIQPSQNEI